MKETGSTKLLYLTVPKKRCGIKIPKLSDVTFARKHAVSSSLSRHATLSFSLMRRPEHIITELTQNFSYFSAFTSTATTCTHHRRPRGMQVEVAAAHMTTRMTPALLTVPPTNTTMLRSIQVNSFFNTFKAPTRAS